MDKDENESWSDAEDMELRAMLEKFARCKAKEDVERDEEVLCEELTEGVQDIMCQAIREERTK
jgi:hypothetical protein